MSASETCHKGIIGSRLMLFTISFQGTLDLFNHKWFNANIHKCPFTYFECTSERKFVLFIWTFADGIATDVVCLEASFSHLVFPKNTLSPKFMSGLMRFFLWTCLGLSELRGEKCALCFERSTMVVPYQLCSMAPTRYSQIWFYLFMTCQSISKAMNYKPHRQLLQIWYSISRSVWALGQSYTNLCTS